MDDRDDGGDGGDGQDRGAFGGLRARLRSVGSALRLIAIFACVGLIVIFTLQNTATVSVEFLFWSLTLSRALLVFLLIVVGTGLGWLLRSMRGHKGFRPLG